MPRLTEQERQRRAAWRRNCVVCGKAFGWNGGGDAARVCSKVCAGTLVGRNGASRFKGGWYSYTCGYCKKDFKDFHRGRRFCSQPCTWAAQRDSMFDMKRGRGRRDANHKEIVKALRDAKWKVVDLADMGGGCPDILAIKDGQFYFVEVKNPESRYGKRGLNKNQKRFLHGNLPCLIAYTGEQVVNQLAEMYEKCIKLREDGEALRFDYIANPRMQ